MKRVILARIAVDENHLKRWDKLHDAPLGTHEGDVVLDEIAEELGHHLREGTADLYSYTITEETVRE